MVLSAVLMFKSVGKSSVDKKTDSHSGSLFFDQRSIDGLKYVGKMNYFFQFR